MHVPSVVFRVLNLSDPPSKKKTVGSDTHIRLLFTTWNLRVFVCFLHLQLYLRLDVLLTRQQMQIILFFNFLIYCLFIIFIFGCVGSSFLCEGPPQLRRAGATPHRGARASHHRGLSRCGAEAPDTQAQQLWPTGPVALRHVGSSQTRARTRVPCIGRQTLNHCATREARKLFLI